jgi:hypothetical protein
MKHNYFSDFKSNTLAQEFFKKGYVILPVENQDGLNSIHNFIFDTLNEIG